MFCGALVTCTGLGFIAEPRQFKGALRGYTTVRRELEREGEREVGREREGGGDRWLC